MRARARLRATSGPAARPKRQTAEEPPRLAPSTRFLLNERYISLRGA